MSNFKTIAESYGRALLVAVATCYMTNPDATAKELISAAVIAIAAPVLRALNPDDKGFGIGSKE